MQQPEIRIPFLEGELAVVDHGGDGSPVLLLHHPGGSAGSWHSLAPFLIEHHRVYALDLPGHGQSTAVGRDAFDTADAIACTCTHLGLDRPVLVSDDCTGYHALVADVRSRIAGAHVLISGFFLSPPESVNAVLDLFVDAQGIAEIVGPRFALGATGTTEKEKSQLMMQLFERTGEGWLVEGTRESAMTAYGRSIRDLPDGTWVRQPLAETLRAYFDLDRTNWFPDGRLVERVTVPVHMIISTEGADAPVLDEQDGYQGPIPANATLHIGPAGVAPRHSAPSAVAEVVDLAADTRTETARRSQEATHDNA